MSKSGFFITGTDTNVGKTVVSTILTLGMRAQYWKPIQSGSIDGTDTEFVNRWTKNSTVGESYVLGQPISPNLAAEAEGIQIDLEKIISNYDELSGTLIVEGAGGVLVPINEKYFIIDLIERLHLPTIVVTSPRLGTINHTLLTFEALQARQIPIKGYITIGEPSPAVDAIILKHSNSKNLGKVEMCKKFTSFWFGQSYCNLNIF